MREEHLATSEQKLETWAYGEWIEEPDEVEWEYKGIKCEIHRNCRIEGGRCTGMGHLCGYIYLPLDHPWANKEEEEIECDIHGGLTYHSQEDGFFEIGFDCAHGCDLMPYSEEKSYKLMMEQIPKDSPEYFKFRDALENTREVNKRLSIFRRERSYKNIQFVKQQCESLVDQALAIKVE